MRNRRDQLLENINLFIGGEKRGTDFAKVIEAGVCDLVDDDDNLDDLKYALAMFGAGKTIADDVEMLIKEFNFALPIINLLEIPE
jgi:hypothetical protein